MANNIKGCLMHTTDDWRTPSWMYDLFMLNGFRDCFPYKADYDELNNNYSCDKLFVNPPFSKLDLVSDWIIKQAPNNLIALLIPSRTDTIYFHKLLKLRPLIIFIKGRLHFNDSNKVAPFPTLLLIFNPYKNDMPLYAHADKALLSFILNNLAYE